MPRDVDPAVHELDGCFLYDIDDLEAVVAETLAGRRAEAEVAERLVVEEAERFREWRASLDVVPAIASLRAHAEEIRAAELAKLASLPEEERDRLEAVTAQILNKLLHEPTVRMKQAAADGDGEAYADGDPAPVRARRRAAERLGARPHRLARLPARADAGRARRGGRPRAAGHEVAFVPITTAGDRDRSSPFGQIGERGVFVKEIEEALLAGRIDVAVHSAKDMTSTDTDGLVVGAYLERDDPRDALVGAERARAGDADRHRVGPPPGAAARARPDALGRAAARQHRHAAAQGAGARPRRAGARRLRARPARARRPDRRCGSRSRRCCPRPPRARSRCRCGPARRSSSRRGDSAETRRRVEAERACVAPIGAGCLAPVAAHHDGERADGADRGRGRQLDRAPRAAPTRRSLAAELLAASERRAA